MNCNTTHYRANSSSVPGDPTQVREVGVRRGQAIAAGENLVVLEQADARIAVAQSEAALAQAEAQLANLKVGKRPAELAVLKAMVRSAKAQAAEARRVLDRTQDLLKRGTATQAQLDDATTQMEVAEAAVNQAEANLTVAALPARAEEIEAAGRQVAQAGASLEQARWKLGERTIKSPSAGRIIDVLRNPGDVAGPSAPVLSILPDGAVKLAVYVPEAGLSALEPGQWLRVSCDGCPSGLRAQISYIAPEPEFTPPVIYSLQNRQKLVYLVEAKPEPSARQLQPGQIVDVWPASDAALP